MQDSQIDLTSMACILMAFWQAEICTFCSTANVSTANDCFATLVSVSTVNDWNRMRQWTFNGTLKKAKLLKTSLTVCWTKRTFLTAEDLRGMSRWAYPLRSDRLYHCPHKVGYHVWPWLLLCDLQPSACGHLVDQRCHVWSFDVFMAFTWIYGIYGITMIPREPTNSLNGPRLKPLGP